MSAKSLKTLETATHCLFCSSERFVASLSASYRYEDAQQVDDNVVDAHLRRSAELSRSQRPAAKRSSQSEIMPISEEQERRPVIAKMLR